MRQKESNKKMYHCHLSKQCKFAGEGKYVNILTAIVKYSSYIRIVGFYLIVVIATV